MYNNINIPRYDNLPLPDEEDMSPTLKKVLEQSDIFRLYVQTGIEYYGSKKYTSPKGVTFPKELYDVVCKNCNDIFGKHSWITGTSNYHECSGFIEDTFESLVKDLRSSES
jgi:predicted ATP-binding protein involved in virulence